MNISMILYKYITKYLFSDYIDRIISKTNMDF